MAQVERIEHSYTVLETAVLPLNYTCLLLYVFLNGADRGSRTPDLSLEGCDFTVKLHLHKLEHPPRYARGTRDYKSLVLLIKL